MALRQDCIFPIFAHEEKIYIFDEMVLVRVSEVQHDVAG